MNDAVRLAAPAAQAALLSLAAWNDLLARRIPDRLCIALAAIGVAARGAAGIEALAWSAALAALIFAAMVPAHALGALGGGDIKLSAALALGLAPAALGEFLTATALAGGVLAALHLALRRLPRPAPCPAGA
ncbi:MAG: prepilin peptidase, partial [Proteobacteria bacterium]|nr:prepilin peptidase [Pseudomonadota bacterium]